MASEQSAKAVNVVEGTEAFVESYRLLAQELASGVAVVAVRHRNRDHAVTVTGWLDVSWDPPTMAVSLFEEGRICEAVEGAGTWTLSVLNRDQESIASWLASPGNPVDGLLSNVPHERVGKDGPVVISNCLAWFHVRTDQIHSVATHQLVVGRVTAMGGPASSSRGGAARQGQASVAQGQSSGAPSQTSVASSGEPLIHWARGFHGLG
ncbi:MULTISPECIES: flavin reductase family protein [Kocuria]|uniref:Flavin reductase n=1 Tax=Kocuria subflava TaxID=1736139 RepID=A0A846TMT0_9MICC|nr:MULTISPECIES: flavin reductase family protein [Kocuria]NKE10518.1 flavin reductase [Kocuria subflava]